MPCKYLLLFFTDFADGFHCLKILCHNRKWFHWTTFQLSQPFHRRLACGITAEMKTPDSLDRCDSARSDHSPYLSNCFSSPLFFSDKIHLGATVVTADRLCIITSGVRIIILVCTGRTHGKFFHAGPLSVIRKGIQDRQSRPAAGTVDKRMQIPPVFRIKHFLFALITDSNIRRDKNLALCLFTFNNIKLPKLRRIFHRLYKKLKDCRTLRRFLLDI